MDNSVIFIVVDSQRYYKSTVDDRGRIDFLDDFAKESIEFTNAITSAPSSVMAAASMFTGIESAYLARNFNDWEFDNSSFDSIQNILQKEGYDIYSIDNSRSGREVTKDLTMPLSKKFFPKGITHRNFWTNLDMVRILENILKMKPKRKSFFMMWFDCRNDPNTSFCVEKSIQLFKDYNLYRDSITIITSDHGYPDPTTGLNKNTMRNMRHDMVVTDDNIKVPLFIKTPDLIKKKIENVVGHVDIFPTLMNLLNINVQYKNKLIIEGQNLITNNGKVENRIIRTDTRLLLQKGRITSLRNSSHKCVIYHDENRKEYYDLINDPKEISPILEVNINIKKNFDDFFIKSNSKIDEYHRGFIENRLKSLENKIFIKNKKIIKILIFGKVNEILKFNLINFFDNKGIYQFTFADELNNNTLQKKKLFNFGFYVTEKRHFSFDDPALFKKYSLYCNKIICFDYNLTFYNRFIVRWLSPLIKYRRNIDFYKDEPILIFYDLHRILKNFYLVYIKKEITENPDMVEVKQLRDRTIRAISQKKEILQSEYSKD